jgi:hypothetical protein
MRLETRRALAGRISPRSGAAGCAHTLKSFGVEGLDNDALITLAMHASDAQSAADTLDLEHAIGSGIL